MPNKRFKSLTYLFCLGLIFISSRGVLSQDCSEPQVANGNFAGDTKEGVAAAIICETGYEGGGTIECQGGNWLSLPPCTPRACPDQNVGNGDLTGELFYKGSAIVSCDTGYVGGGAAECGSNGAWVTVPACTPIDCSNPNVPNGISVASTRYGEGHFIQCNTGYTGGGAVGIECLADGTWSITLSCDPRVCGDPQVANGNLAGDNFYDGTASIECLAGYEGGGSLTCQSSGAWGAKPSCDPKDCGQPTEADGLFHGSLTLTSSTLYDGDATVECDPGYIGGGTATCLTTGNWDIFPVCNPKDCGQPTAVDGLLHGSLSPTSSTFYDGEATVVCDAGYTGGGTATCLTTGAWDPLPPCNPRDCGTPDITNGGLQAGSDTVYSGSATVECNLGYEGGGVATCLDTGNWDTLPTCSPVDCGTPTISNGAFSGETFYTGSAVVVCDNGYDGTGAAICSTDATWDTLPVCTPKNCGPLTVPNGVFSGDTVYAADASVTCNAGYDFSGVVECGSDGIWATPTPTCSAKDCGDPRQGNPDLIHSDMIGTNPTLFDGTAFFQCHDGYEGGGTATCQNTGDWGPLPTCSPKDCGIPTTPNGKLTAESTTVFNGTAVVECNEGYEGGGVATCLDVATWDTLPACTPVDCGSPTIPNGDLTIGSDTVYSGTATAECDTGYELAGSDVATCLSNGNWDTLPVCNPKDCGPLTDPVHGSVSAPVTTYTNVATYTCQSLWQLNGAATLICGADGNWAPDPPTCDDIDCPTLETPTDGSLSTGVVHVGTSVSVSCNPGYTLFGDELIQCETGGTWNTTVGTCRRDCPVLTSPTNGILSTTEVAEGTVVGITCDSAYTLEGANQVSCLPGGSWNDVLPDCTEDCQPLTVPDHGSISTNTLSQGTVVFVECESGYTLFGATTLQCRTDALWNNVEPTCKLDCPSLSPPQNGGISTNIWSQDTIVTFSCNAGYTLFGDNQLTCLSDSTWDLPDPVCKEDCPTLSHPANGFLDTLEPRQTTVATVYCNGGYTLFGASSLTCQSDATWDFPMPECREDCPDLTPPTDGSINSTAVKQGTEVGVDCDTDFTLFGASLLTCQSDATWDHPVPECKQDCPVLTPPTNGVINETEIKSQGTVVGVDCDNAYTLFGDAVLTCQSDASWDFAIPECKQDCPILTPPTNGAINTTIESQGTVVGVDCDQFYTLFGDSVLTCQSDATWDTVLPLCKRDCRPINIPSNGGINNLNVSQETVVVFTCDFGYTLFGATTVICQSDATWNNTEPSCEKDCPTLNIPNGSKSTTIVILGTVVDVTCDLDYSLEGEAELTCLTGGLWNYDTPLCTKDCRSLVPPTNGRIDTLAVSQDTVVVVECDTNYTLFGASMLTCLDNAQWDFPEPVCRLDCPILILPANAIFSTTDNHENVTVTVSCDPYFTRFGHEFITCRPGGFWDNSLPTCRRDCPALVWPTYGSIDPTDVKEGTVATVTCNAGYTLIGTIHITCLPGGEWDLFIPDCDRECGPLGHPSNGLVIFSDGTTLNKEASYTCDTGYDPSHYLPRVCQSDGTWSRTEPICIIRDCGSIFVPSNGGVSFSNGVTTFREIATFTCDPGYILTGDETRICLSDETWAGTSPTCVIKDCGPLTNPTYGIVNTGSGTTFGEVAKYFCNIGYNLIGDSERLCDADGLWDRNPPICEIKDCGMLTIPSNGDVSFTDTVYNYVAYYSCHTGYDLMGVSSRVCQQDATWSASPPVCEIKDCGFLSAPTKGTVSYSNSATTYQEIATYSCDAGYTLTGVENRACLSTGQWGATAPVCIIKDCGRLPSPVFGTINTASGTTFGKSAYYFCNFGYTLNGVSQRLCQSDGLWSDTAPFCEINECGALTDPDSGAVSVTQTIYNEIASYTCNPGYDLIGVSQRVCKEDKTWSHSAPVCVIKDCGSPSTILYGNVTIPNGTEYNATAIYTCGENRGLVGNEAIFCLSTGFWDTPPVCNLDCGLPADLPNGRYSIHTDTLTGSIATYSCDNGFILIGDPDVTCLITGSWESSPTCRIIPMAFEADCYVTAQCTTARSTCRSDGLGATKCLCAATGEVYRSAIDTCLAYCGFLTAPTNGYIILPEEPSEGENVTYTCDPGFALSDVAMTTRTCQATKQWSGTAPLCVVGCSDPPKLNNGNEETPEGMAAGRRVYYKCNSGYILVGETFRECLPDSTWNGNTPVCSIECKNLSTISHGIVDQSAGNWESSVATYYCEKDYALVGTATRICQPSGDWTGVEPDCIYAIFPDVLLVIGSLLIFLVIIDIFVVLAIIYMRYSKKKKKDNPQDLYFDDLDEPKSGHNQPVHDVTPVEAPIAGVAPVSYMADGPARSSFRQAQNIKAASEATAPKAIPQIPKLPQASKDKKSLLNRIPKPKPLMRGLRGRGKRPKFYGPEAPIGLHATPRTFQSSATDEFADVKIAEMERYLKDGDDLGTPSSSDFNRRSTADEEKVSLEHLPSSRLTAGDKMVLMDFDGQDELPATKLEEPPRSYSGPSPPKGSGEGGWDSDKNYPIDSLRPHTPIFPHQRQSEV